MYKQLRKDKLAFTFLKPNKFNHQQFFSSLTDKRKLPKQLCMRKEFIAFNYYSNRLHKLSQQQPLCIKGKIF